MNHALTEIAFILDRSGSMISLAAAAIDGFNHFLREQQSAPGHAKLTLVLFDDEYLCPALSVPIADVCPLDTTTYIPRNSTALLDAIGRTIDELGDRLRHTPEHARPGKVIIAILTDGLENASTRYTWQDIARRIKHQTEKYAWQFLFLGANQDAIATAARLHIFPQNAATYQADAIGHCSGSAALARKVRAARAAHSHTHLGTSLTHEELQVCEASMEQVLQNEDQQRRKEK